MKRTLKILLVLFLFSHIFYAQNHLEIKPSIKKQPVYIQFIEKELVYYPINKKKAINFSVKDLDKVVIYSRKSTEVDESFYTINYMIDNHETQVYKSSSVKIDSKSSFKDKSVQKKVSRSFKKTIQIPKGAATLSLISKKSRKIIVNLIGYKGSKKIKLKPQDIKIEPQIILWGKSLKYYKLNSEKLTKIDLNESGKLLIYTRLRMSENKTTNYDFSYNITNQKTKKIHVDRTSSSKKTAYRSTNILEIPSIYQKTTINIKNDFQSILFSSDDPVDARFLFIKETENKEWRELFASNNVLVPLIVKKDNQKRLYNKITATKSFNFKINATRPTKLKLNIRGEFTYDMHANNDYEIVLSDNGKIVNTYKLSCHRSNVMKYESNDELIPGTLDKLYIDVPIGNHNYSLKVNNREKTALVRVFKKTFN